MYKTSKSMIQLETELFNYINEIRTHPETFAKSLIKEDNNPNIKNFLQSLSRFCIGKIPLLKKEPLLQKCTKEMLTTIILHDNGTDIIKFTPQEKENYRLKNRLKRIEHYGNYYHEFIVFGGNDAEEIIKKIISNNNYQDKLFDPKMRICGIACEILPSNRICSVIDLVDFLDNNNQFQDEKIYDEKKYRKKYETRSYNPNLNTYPRLIKEPGEYIYETEYKRNKPQYNKYGFNRNERIEELNQNYKPYSNRTYNNKRIIFENREDLNNSDDDIVYSNSGSKIIMNPLEETEGLIDNYPLQYSTRTTPIKKYNYPFEQRNKHFQTNTYNYKFYDKNYNISNYENKENKSLFAKQKPGVTYQEKIIPDVDGTLINVMAKKTVFEDGSKLIEYDTH